MSTENTKVITKTKLADNTWFSFQNYKQIINEDGTYKTYWVTADEYSDIVVKNPECSTDRLAIKSIISINKSIFDVPRDKVISVYLKVTPKEGGSFSANGEVCYYGAYTDAMIDLSDLLTSDTTSQYVNIELTGHFDYPFFIYASGQYAPVFEMVYYEDGELITKSINVCNPPRYINYLDGERFNPKDMTITVNYTNGGHLTISEGFTYTPQFLQYGDKAVTISYDGKTCKQAVNVLEDSFSATACKSAGEYGENPKVNLSTGRLLYTLPCMNIGANDRAIDVTAFYSSVQDDLFEQLLSNMPKGWKLNVQQFIKKQGQSTYLYLDGNGYLHQFKLYDEAAGLYHECEEAGLVLAVKGNTFEITDESNNKLLFDSSGRLTDIVSGLNSNIRKVFSYVDDKLVRIYDARSQIGSADGYNESLMLTYNEQGLLDEIQTLKGDECLKATKFVYSGRNLIRFDTRVGSSVIQWYRLQYNDCNLLQRVSEINGINATVINYDDDCRVSEIQYAKGYVTDQYVYAYKTVESFRFDYKMMDHTEWVLSTVVTNKNNVSIIYYLNRKNEIVSSFEVVKDEQGQMTGLKDLALGSTKTLTSTGGSILINGNTCAAGSSGQYIYYNIPDDFTLWRDDDEKVNKFYGCTFYLKHKEICERLKLTANYEFALNGVGCGERETSIFIDGDAYDVWQKVNLVLELPENKNKNVKLKALRISIKNLNSYRAQKIEISPLNFAPSAKNSFLAANATDEIDFNQISQITLTKPGDGDNITIENTTDTNYYFTEQDLLRTALNKMHNSYIVDGVACFDVICGNGRRRISKIKDISITANGKVWQINQPQLTFINRIVSQNGSATTTQKTILKPNEISLEKVVTSANNHSSTSCTLTNYHGQTLSETDEYGVTTEYTYDDSGNLIKTVLLGRNVYGEREGRMVCSVSTYDADGYLASMSDGMNTVTYEYKKPFDVVTKESVIVDGVTYEKLYEYSNNGGRLLSVIRKVNGVIKSCNALSYSKGMVRTLTDGYVKYGIIYDAKSNSTTYTVFKGDREIPVQIQTEVFDEKTFTTKTETRYIKDDTQVDVVTAVYDLYGRINGVHYGPLDGDGLNADKHVTYAYGSFGGASQFVQPVSSVTDEYNNKLYRYERDHDGNARKYVRYNIFPASSFSFTAEQENDGVVYMTSKSDKSKSQVCYDESVFANPRITKIKKYYADTSHKTLSEIECLSSEYTYNPLGLLAKKRINCGNGSVYDYTYDTDGKGNVLPRFKKVRYFLEPENFCDREYTYDGRGNILIQKVTSTSYYNDPSFDSYTMYYTYDQNNRLVNEEKRFNSSGEEVTLWQKTYSYDSYGRLIKAISNDGKDAVTTSYSHDVLGRTIKATFGDKTVNYAYDTAGNLLSATGDTDKPFSCTWSKGGLLESITVDGSTTSYAYDHQNIRIGKSGAATRNYLVDGTKIIGESSGAGLKLVYYYDGDSLVGFKFYDKDNVIYPKACLGDGFCYQFIKDEQNNVIGISDCVGALVARYEYDAWGNHKVLDANGVVNNDPNFIGNLNPFRYRGYYYDVETGLYYCNARYYSPQLRHWISPDSFSYLDPESIYGLNLYAYCGNDPVNHIDPSGHFSLPNWAKWVIGGVAFVGAVALTCLTCGALAPVFIGMAGSVLLDGVVEGAISSANGGNFWEGFADGAANGAMWGGIFALGGAALRTIKMFKNGVAIGENMKRVKNLAKAGHQITYNGMPGFKFVKMFGGDDLARTLLMRHNQAFIERMMKWGVKIVDFGIDMTRDYRSFYYLMETIVSNGYGLLQLMY